MRRPTGAQNKKDDFKFLVIKHVQGFGYHYGCKRGQRRKKTFTIKKFAPLAKPLYVIQNLNEGFEKELLRLRETNEKKRIGKKATSMAEARGAPFRAPLQGRRRFGSGLGGNRQQGNRRKRRRGISLGQPSKDLVIDVMGGRVSIWKKRNQHQQEGSRSVTKETSFLRI